MPLIRTKDNVPQTYVSESRDFQLLLRILDVTQNSVKFDIDSIVNILDNRLISSTYLELLKSKIGFITSSVYDDDVLRVVLSAFPHIMRYKGSARGITRAVNTYLNAIGVTGSVRMSIYNNDSAYPYTVRVGVSKEVPNSVLLRDILSYVLPSGYKLEIYTYSDTNAAPSTFEFSSKAEHLEPDAADKASAVRNGAYKIELEDRTYNTVQMSTAIEEATSE